MKTNPFITLASTAFFGASAAFSQTWIPTHAPTNLWYAIAMSADGTKLVAAAGGQTSSGQIYTSTNSGMDWAVTTAPSNRWVSVASSADGTELTAVVFGG